MKEEENYPISIENKIYAMQFGHIKKMDKQFYSKNFVALILRNFPLNYDYREISNLLKQ